MSAARSSGVVVVDVDGPARPLGVVIGGRLVGLLAAGGTRDHQRRDHRDGEQHRRAHASVAAVGTNTQPQRPPAACRQQHRTEPRQRQPMRTSVIVASDPLCGRPSWPDDGALKRPLKHLGSLPPLVFAGEALALTAQLADVAEGKAFLL